MGREAFLRQKRHAALAVNLLITSGVLAACSQGGATPIPQQELPPNTDVTEEVPVVVVEEPVEDTPPLPETDQNCLDCHTDEEVLKELATEAEPAETPSSGEG
jgi:hypothetical protein